MATEIIRTRFQWRRDTAAAWASVNPILLLAEPGLETDTDAIKYGDGISAWNDLPYASGGSDGLGDVVGPASSVDGRAALFDGTTGKLLRQSSAAPVLEGDARLTNSRTPTAHAASHADGGADAITVAQGQVTGLAAALTGKETAGAAAAAIAAHEAAGDPHTQYLTETEGNSRYRQSSTALTDGDIPSTIARDSEVTAAISAHEGAADPHPGYLTAAEGNAAYAPVGQGVTNGNSHNHDGGDGVQIAYGSLSGLPTLPTGVTDGDKGDITVSASGATWTIDGGAVSLGKLASVSTQRILARNAAGSGSPESLTLTTVLDWLSASQGTVIFRGASTWQALSPGTTGQFLRTGGAAADVTWATVAGGGDALVASPLSQFAATTSAQFLGVISNPTGTGLVVANNGPTLIAPILGTPASGTLTNCTGLPAAGVTGLGTLATLSALGNITSAGAIGSTANLPIITTTGGALSVGSFGTGANTFCVGNDSRLSDARTPTAHNQAWSTITATPTTLSDYGITDAQPLDSDLTSIAALTTTTYGRSQLALADAAADTAQLNVFSSSLKGLAPASGGGTTNFLRADGAYAAPRGGYADDNYAIPANVLLPQATGPALATITTTTNGIKTGAADFDGVAVEIANFTDARPKNWSGANPTAKFLWRAAASGSGAVTWGIAITALNEGDVVDVAPTWVEVNDAVVTAEHDQLTAATSAISIQGSVTADSRLQFWIRRNPADGSDTMSQDARLVAVILTFALT